MMKIDHKPVAVVLAPSIPNPRSSAGCLRLHELLILLSSSFTVYLLLPCNDSDTDNNTIRNYSVIYNCNRKKLIRLSLFIRPKLVLYEFWFVAERYYPLAKLLWSRAVHVLDCVDIEHVRRSDITGVCLDELRGRELSMIRSFSYVLFVSTNDVEYVVSLVPLTSQHYVYPVPFVGDELREYSCDSNTLLFIGTMGHPPNKEGIEWFIGECLPELIERNGQIKLLVVGRGSENLTIPENTLHNVELMGMVSDIRSEYERSTIAIAPLLSGSGCNGKVVEAMGFGVPVVGTCIAAVGVGAKSNCDMKVVSDSRDMINAIIGLLDNRNELVQLRSAGLLLVEQKFSKRVIASTVEWLVKISR